MAGKQIPEGVDIEEEEFEYEVVEPWTDPGPYEDVELDDDEDEGDEENPQVPDEDRGL